MKRLFRPKTRLGSLTKGRFRSLNRTQCGRDDFKYVISLSHTKVMLVRKGFMDEDVAFSAFTSADILGFLWPIEKAFAKNYVYDKSLERLYDRWQQWKK